MKNLFVILLFVALGAVATADMMRKSIVFDPSTPKVFYCPQEKPRKLDKMMVKSRPIEKLCEFNGKGLPKGYKSDCYNDVDESEYACSEKERILMRINPPSDEEATTTTTTPKPKGYKKGKSYKWKKAN